MSTLHIIKNDQDERIHVWHKKPLGIPKGLVIRTHGLASSEDTPHNEAMTDPFLEKGYAVLDINARCSNSNIASGKLDDYTMGGQVDDFRAVLEWVNNKHPEWTMGQPAIISGHSMGGYVALKIAAEGNIYENFQIGKAIPISPVISGQALTDIMGELDETHEEPASGNTGKSNVLTSKGFDEYRTHDLMQEDFDSCEIDICIIQAGDDTICPPEHAYELCEKFPRIKIRVIDGLDHRFQREIGEDLVVAADEISDVISSELEKFEQTPRQEVVLGL